jgi:Flp pilus assembly protein TadB
MKETVTEYEVEANEVEHEQYRSDFSGRVLEEDEMVSLVLPDDVPSATDRVANPHVRYTGQGTHLAAYPDPDNEERYDAFNAALKEVERKNDNPNLFTANDTIHLHIEEYAELKGVDTESIDADTEVPETYDKMVHPTVETTEKSWVDVTIGEKVELDLLCLASWCSTIFSAYTLWYGQHQWVAGLALSALIIFGFLAVSMTTIRLTTIGE